MQAECLSVRVLSSKTQLEQVARPDLHADVYSLLSLLVYFV